MPAGDRLPMEDIVKIVFAIAVFGHGVAHLAVTFNLGGQLIGNPTEGVPEVGAPIMANHAAAGSRSSRASGPAVRCDFASCTSSSRSA
jgi:hypothetical protein